MPPRRRRPRFSPSPSPSSKTTTTPSTTHWTTLLTTPTPLSNLSSAKKHHILKSIATDISTAFIQIAHLLETSVLDTEHTAPIENVIALILRVEERHSRDLERQVRRAERREERRVRRWIRERRWMRKCWVGLLGRAMEVSGRWRERVRYLEEMRSRLKLRAGGKETGRGELVIRRFGLSRDRGKENSV